MAIDYTKWLFKYKLLHVLMWLMVALFSMLSYYDYETSVRDQFLWALLFVVICMPAFYLAAYRLIPRLLYKKKFGAYIFSLIALVLLSTAAGFFILRGLNHLLTGEPVFMGRETDYPLTSVLIWDNLLAIACSSTLKIISDRFRIEKRLHEVEKEKIRTELDFLRSQINPHFLFNVMNTIYFQINKDNAQARGSIERLSELLRYQLYECTTDKIAINKELAYLKNYVAIQAMRMETGSDVKLQISDNFPAFKIAPLLIQPLVENAFKHVSHFKESRQNKVHIFLGVDSSTELTVYVANTYDKSNHTKHLINSGGLGIQNLKRRLELLYPEKHSLDIAQKEDVFETTLKIRYDY
ncbi:MAG: hypothetical protein BGO69_06925 [Bacteroidetes bacterium 46-16]|nr:MAG: hypothetical protein BGO69_06925 [Bacteroidetes bacterium 46-16]